MIKQLMTSLALAMLASSLAAADSTNRMFFPLAGFSIAPLDAAPGNTPSQTAVMMFLPPSDNFAANVNVMIQSYPGTMEEYTALTVKQFKDNGLKLISQKSLGNSAAIFEYSGLMRGSPVHWFARVEKSGEHVYLVTASAAETQWSKLAPQLKACVESFRCEKH